MGWQQTYAEFLKHGGYTADRTELDELLNEATNAVTSLPEPYRARAERYLNNLSRDDFIQVDWELLEALGRKP